LLKKKHTTTKRKRKMARKERAIAQRRIKRETKPATRGCLILILIVVVIWLIGVFSPSKKEVAPIKSATQIKKSIPQPIQEDEDILKKLVDSGVVESINPYRNEVFVNPVI